jgi:hypothetical protein
MERLKVLGQQQPRSLRFLEILAQVVSLVESDDRAKLVQEAAIIGEKWWVQKTPKPTNQTHTHICRYSSIPPCSGMKVCGLQGRKA